MTEASRSLRLSVALASAAALAYEILLLRLFSITQFHHTAYMVISLALLGYGASGTVLAVVGSRPAASARFRFTGTYGACLVAASLSMLVCFSLAQRLAVHPEEMLWQPSQLSRLGLMYLLLAIPFLFVGLAVALALMSHGAAAVYAWDLLGAGAGSVLVVLLLWRIPPQEVLRWLAALPLLAAALVWLFAGAWTGRRLVATGLAALAVMWIPEGWLEPRLSPYKGLSQALRVRGAEVVDEFSTPLSTVTVLRNSIVPLRHAPGLSLAAPSGPPEQLGLFIDGDALTAVTRATDRDALAYLDHTTAALPYHVGRSASVLVLGTGGGEGVLRARYQGAERVVSVELDPTVVRLLREGLDHLTGGLYTSPGVELELAEIRGYAARPRRASISSSTSRWVATVEGPPRWRRWGRASPTRWRRSASTSTVSRRQVCSPLRPGRGTRLAEPSNSSPRSPRPWSGEPGGERRSSWW